MSEALTEPPAGHPFWDYSYAGCFLAPIDAISRELSDGIAERKNKAFTYFRANIYGFSGYDDWTTCSWLEVAHAPATGEYRVLWKSGAEVENLPAAWLSDWGNAPTAEDALNQIYDHFDAKGTPMVGICFVNKRQGDDGRIHNTAVIYGFTNPDEADQ